MHGKCDDCVVQLRGIRVKPVYTMRRPRNIVTEWNCSPYSLAYHYALRNAGRQVTCIVPLVYQAATRPSSIVLRQSLSYVPLPAM